MLSSILGILSGLFQGIATALGWAKQRSDQQTGSDLQAAQTAVDNLSVIKAELNAAVQAPKTEADVLKRLGEGSA